MKTRKILAILLSVLMICQLMVPMMTASAATSGTCGDNLTWTFNASNEELIISGTGPMYNYAKKTAPWWDNFEKISLITVNEGVTSIGEWAFSYLMFARKIVLPDTLETIGTSAFYKCLSVDEILVPDSVTSLGRAAFAYCQKMRSVSIPAGIDTIDKLTFCDCKNLIVAYYSGTESEFKAMKIDATNVELANIEIKYETEAGIYWEIVDGVLTISGFGQMDNFKDRGAPWYSTDNMTAIKKVVIEDGIVTIGNYAFSRFMGCEEFVLPESVVYIGQNAFYRCAAVTSIVLPSKLDIIMNGCFAYCAKLKEVTFSSNVKTIKASVFTGTALETVNYDGTAFQFTGVFVDDKSDGNAEFHAAAKNYLVASIEYSYDDTTDTLTIFGNTFMDDFPVREAPWYADYCATTKKIVVKEGVENISGYAFYDFKVVEEVEIPDSVTSIGFYAFAQCPYLDNVVIPKTVTSLGSNIFYNGRANKGLTTVTIPKSVTEIPQNTFYGQTSLATVYYEGTEEDWAAMNIVTKGNDPLFAANIVCGYQYPSTEPDEPDVPVDPEDPVVEFTGFEFVDGVLTITENIPDFESGKAPWAEYAADITTVVFAEGVTEIGEYAFENTAITSIVLPEGLTTIPSNAFAGCALLEEVTVPASLTTVEANAADGCTALATIYFDGTEEEFAAISIGENNDAITAAEIVFTGKPGGGIELPDFDII